jgi:hypothetical protein
MIEWGSLGKVFIGVGLCVVVVGLLLIADRVQELGISWDGSASFRRHLYSTR